MGAPTWPAGAAAAALIGRVGSGRRPTRGAVGVGESLMAAAVVAGDRGCHDTSGLCRPAGRWNRRRHATAVAHNRTLRAARRVYARPAHGLARRSIWPVSVCLARRADPPDCDLSSVGTVAALAGAARPARRPRAR